MKEKKINKFLPNGKEIKRLRKLSGIKQKNIPAKISKVIGKGVGLRSYQRAEQGKNEMDREFIEWIANFYDLYFKEKGISENVSFENLITGKSVSEKQKGPIPNSFDEIEESVFLHRISSYEQAAQIIRKSSKRKIFYPSSPTPEQINNIKNVLKDLTKIYEEQNKGFKEFFKTKDMIDTDKYEDVNKELQVLDSVSNLSESMRKLNKSGIHLYSANYILHNIGLNVTPEEIGDKAIYQAGLIETNYAIFCFESFQSASITFKYKNPYSAKKLMAYMAKHPFNSMSGEANDDNYYIAEDSISNWYYGDPEVPGIIKINAFNRNRANLAKSDVKELLTDEELEKIRQEEYDSLQEQGMIVQEPDYEPDDDYFDRDG